MTTSPLKVEEEREKFEAWAKKQRLGLAYGDCGYVFSSTMMAWRAWQDSRAAIVVELPQRKEPTSSGHYGEGYLAPNTSGTALDYDDTVDALRAAGITVKGDN